MGRDVPKMTTAELRALADEPTATVREAGRAFGLGTNSSYELIARGEFPCRVLKLGRKLRVPTADLLRVLGVEFH